VRVRGCESRGRKGRTRAHASHATVCALGAARAPRGRGARTWHVRDDQAVGHATVLLQNHEVAEALGAARLHDLLHRVAATVHAVGVGHQQLDLLEELRQLAARIVRRRHEHFGVGDARVRVLGVDALGRRAARGVVQLSLGAQLIRVLAQLQAQWWVRSRGRSRIRSGRQGAAGARTSVGSALPCSTASFTFRLRS
jgi:hypothetical protein